MIGLKSRESQVITLTDPPDTTPLQLLGFFRLQWLWLRTGPATTTLLEGGVQVIGSFDTLGNDRNPVTSAGPLTSTATTAQVQLDLGETITSTGTRTSTVPTTVITSTTSTSTHTATRTAGSPVPGTNPPVVRGSYTAEHGASVRAPRVL